VAEFLQDVDGRIVAAALALLMAATLEAGYRLGRRHRDRVTEAARSQIGAIQGATLGLLALLLGFSFSLALQRHDDRGRALVAEANALGTAWLRSGLLPDALRGPAQASIAGYIRVRIESTSLPQNEHARLAEFAGREAAMQQDLWRHALAAAAPTSALHPQISSLFVESINEAIDAYGVHAAALSRHVPQLVVLLLLLSFGLAGSIVGYASGVHGHRGVVSNTLMLGLITVLVYLIVDLDRPRRGLIMVDPAPMQALLALLPPLHR
jgi:hypothetical protein